MKKLPCIFRKMIWKKALSLEDFHKKQKNSMSAFLKITFTEVGKDFLKATMPVEVITKQPYGLLHGGANAVLAETVASAAANYCIEDPSLVAVGVELNVNHLKAVKEGEIEAKASPLHIGKKTQVWQIEIFQKKVLTAISRLTLMVIAQ